MAGAVFCNPTLPSCRDSAMPVENKARQLANQNDTDGRVPMNPCFTCGHRPECLCNLGSAANLASSTQMLEQALHSVLSVLTVTGSRTPSRLKVRAFRSSHQFQRSRGL